MLLTCKSRRSVPVCETAVGANEATCEAITVSVMSVLLSIGPGDLPYLEIRRGIMVLSVAPSKSVNSEPASSQDRYGFKA